MRQLIMSGFLDDPLLCIMLKNDTVAMLQSGELNFHALGSSAPIKQ